MRTTIIYLGVSLCLALLMSCNSRGQAGEQPDYPVMTVTTSSAGMVETYTGSIQGRQDTALDACYVLAIVNIGLTTDLQKKYEEKDIATSVIIGYSLSSNEVKLYWLDDRYDFDLYSIQKGDSITLYYPHTSQENKKKAIAINNHSFQERIRKNDSIYIDVDFFDMEEKWSLPPSLDDGLFLRWEIAKQRFIRHIIKDSQGLHRLDVENEDDLRLSKRTFGQLYCLYILAHNETIRNEK